MPVQEQTPYIKYVANGVTQTFSTEFDCESKDQLVVMLNGEEPAFTSWSYADKQVTFVTAPVVDTVVELKRQSKLNRTTDYQSFNHTLNYKALNSDFDRIWYAIQEQNYKAGQYDYDYNFVLTQVRPINTGGTGADNPVSARNNLNVYSRSQVDALVATGGQGSIVSIEGGGTGAENKADARNNLEIFSKTETEEKINELVPSAGEVKAGKAKIATTAISQAGTNDTDIITAKKLRDALNASGVLPIYGLRSWGIIKGTTTPASLGRGVNVASIVDEGVGQYKVTFITAMPNIDYVILTGATSYSTTDLGTYGAVKMGSKTVNGFSIICGAQNYVDVPEIYFGVTY